MKLSVKQKVDADGPGAGFGAAGVRVEVGERGGAGGGIQDETDPTWIPVIASSVVPVELGLQADEAALVGLKSFKQVHCAPQVVPACSDAALCSAR